MDFSSFLFLLVNVCLMQVNGIIRICGVCCESSFKTIDEPIFCWCS